MNRHHETSTKGFPSPDFLSARFRERTALVVGILTILAGGAAIIVPRLAGIPADFFIGIILLFDGIVQGVYASQLRGRRELWWRVAGALLACSAGILLLTFPLRGVLTLSLFIAAFLVVSGGVKIVWACYLPSRFRWNEIFLAGILSVLLGLGFAYWPEGAGWIISVVIGVDLIFSGWRLIAAEGTSGTVEDGM